MKIFLIIFITLFAISCSPKKVGVFWCGDHQCVNKAEKEDFFKKYMIVERRVLKELNAEEKKRQQKIFEEAKINEEKRVKNEKLLAKEKKIKKKQKLIKQKKLIEKQKTAKKNENITEIFNEDIKKESDEVTLKRSDDEKKILQEEIELEEIEIFNDKTNSAITNNNKIETVSSSPNTVKFDDIFKDIMNRNKNKSFPDINNTPD